MTDLIKVRRVVHFAGFEPLDAEAHHARYNRALAKSASTFAFDATVGTLQRVGKRQEFLVSALGPNWATETSVTVLDHSSIINKKLARPFLQRLGSGFAAAFLVIIFGGLFNYFRAAWRFAFFFLFPFVFMALGIFLAILLSVLPLFLGHLPWLFLFSLPAAAAGFYWLFLPYANRLHTMLLMADWQVAIDLVTKRDQDLNAVLDRFSESLIEAISEPADEYVISSHSMGGAMMIETLGAVLEKHPDVLNGKKIVVCSMGGAGLQCTLLKPAAALRAKAQIILNNPNVVWVDVQCLTDVANFYKAKFSELHGFKAASDTKVILVRVKNMVTVETYKRIKKDLLRVHRQFVLGSEQRSNFDYGLLTIAPFSAREFAGFTSSNLPPIGVDGSLKS